MKQPHAPMRFISIKWKSTIALAALLLGLLAILITYYYQNFQQSFHAALADRRISTLANLDRAVNQRAEDVYRHIKTYLISPDFRDESEELLQLRDTIQTLEKFYAQQWLVDEIIVKQANANPSDESTAQQGWIERWLQQDNNPVRSPISLVCLETCKQLIAVPIYHMNARWATVFATRPIDGIGNELFENQGSYLAALQNEGETSANNTLDQWAKTVFPAIDNFDFPSLIQSIETNTSLSTLLGTTMPVAMDSANDVYGVTAIPVRGNSVDTAVFIVADNVTTLRSNLLREMMKQLAIVASIIFVFMVYLITLSWRHLNKVNQQIAVLPLLGEKKFREARELINKHRKQGIYHDELDTLDDAVNALSYQLESLEKAVNIRTREMERLSLFDTLTGLANRNLFQYELQTDVERFKQEGGVLAAVILDLDKFKRVNDSINHQQGDELLGKVGLRLKNATKSLGLAARLGGDEYAVIVRSAKSLHEVELICEKILNLIHKPIELGDEKIVISCSLGIALANAALSYDDLIRNAEIAMYNAKDAGGNTYRVFNQSMASRAHANLSLESEIRRAFEKKEFTLYLQPKVNMAKNIEGFEALVRWDHPERGLVPPIEFIPAMENMGLISYLDNFVLEASCRQLNVLQKHYADVSIAVNISSAHFTDKAFFTFLQQCLDKYPINPSRLELEITETLLMENMSVGMDVVNKIKGLGVSIAIDDFGTGYSSLSYLKKLPVDIIKIDREFIKDIPDSESDMQISSVIIFLAKQLNFKVVAEGVETKEQLAFLKANQCDLAQGFLFSKPIPAHKAMVLLESQRRDQQPSHQAAL